MKTTTIAALVLGAAATATILGLAPTPAATSRTTSLDAASTRQAFNIDPSHSCGIFRVHHQQAGMFYALFDRVTGTIEYDAENPAATSFDVTIDIESVHTGSEESNGNLDRLLMGPAFFNAKEFPTMGFKSTSVEVVDDDTLAVTGDFTIRDTTKSITVNMDLTGLATTPRGPMVGFETIFEIDRTEYGVSYMAESDILGNQTRVLVSMEAGVQ